MLYELLCAIDDRHDSPDVASLSVQLKTTHGDACPDTGGWEKWLEYVLLSVVSGAHVQHHTGIVAEAARIRRFSAACVQVVTESREIRPGLGECDPWIDAHEAAIYAAAHGTRTKAAGTSIGVAAELALAEMEREGIAGIPTGLLDLDKLLMGLHEKELVVIAARPSKGKTSLAFQIALNVARNGEPVLFASLEMSELSIGQRALANLARVDGDTVRGGRKATTREHEALRAAASELHALPITLIDEGGLSTARLRALARRHASRNGLSLLIVDYLQLMTHPGAESRFMEVSAVSMALKNLAKEIPCAVLATSQLSRAADGEELKLSHLRESGQIEQDAGAGVMLDANENGTSPMLAKLKKNRQGRAGDCQFAWMRSHFRVCNLDPLSESLRKQEEAA